MSNYIKIYNDTAILLTMTNWLTAEEMRDLLLSDGVDPAELPMDRVERLLDELVEEGVMRQLHMRYQIVDPDKAIEYIEENA